jgi:hypothetical protein
LFFKRQNMDVIGMFIEKYNVSPITFSAHTYPQTVGRPQGAVRIKAIYAAKTPDHFYVFHVFCTNYFSYYKPKRLDLIDDFNDISYIAMKYHANLNHRFH